MTPENFCYWLQGFFEITDANTIYPEELNMIKEHLELALSKENVTQRGTDNNTNPIGHVIPDKLKHAPFSQTPLIITKPTTGNLDNVLIC